MTPSQTVGPFFAYALPYEGGPQVVRDDHPGAVLLHGRVLDGAGEPIPDGLVEIWQAGADGLVSQKPGALCRDLPEFSGFGRCPTDLAGGYRFRTLCPGGAAAYIAMFVFARGLLKPVLTRVYFDLADVDPLVPAERRATLVADRDGDAAHRFDVHLQGERETVFFAW